MFLLNIKMAFRYLKSHVMFSLINILGLTLGFFCFFLLNAYVLKETSYDLNQQEVYRLLEETKDENGTSRQMASLAPRVGAESEILFDEIEKQTQILYIGRGTIGNDPNTVSHEHMAVLDDQFLQVFDFTLVEGSVAALSNQVAGIILTETLKDRYFGSGPALDKMLKTSYGEYPIVGVLKDFPENSHLENMAFISQQVARNFFNGWDDRLATNWTGNDFITYFKLVPNTDLTVLGNKITALSETNYPESETFNSKFFLQRVQDIHLYPQEVEGEINKAKGNDLYVNLFFWVAVFILLVACFNYAGLQNIAFMDRSKEIGMRQIVGADKLHLFLQFLSESLVLTTISMGFAYFLLWISQPLIQSWFDTTINLQQIPLSGMILTLITGLFLSLLSVAYPFWLIVRKNRVTLKDTSNAAKLPFRRFMLVFQSVAVIAFLTASLVFSKQMEYLKSREVGFEMDGIATIDINSRILRNKFEAIKAEFLRIPAVNTVSVVSRVPAEWKNIPQVQTVREGQSNLQAKNMLFIATDQDFLQTFQINLLEGANFANTDSDSSKVLLNESAVEALGLENPIGQYIQIPFVNFGGDNRELEVPYKVQIAGVVEDFQMEDFRTSIKPLVIGNWNNPIHSIDYYTLKIQSKDWQKTLLALKQVNDSFDPSTPIELNHLDEKFARFFETDMIRFKLLNFFSGVIVFLAIMGLFAMSAYVARSRTKEIGIRKVIGASVPELVRLLSQDFLNLMLIGFTIAAPISWHLLREWLADFAFHIDLSWWMIVVAGLGCLFLTLTTVSFQSIKTALSNPIDALRAE